MLTQNRSDSFSVTHDWALQEWGLKPTSLLDGEHGREQKCSGASGASALFRAASLLRPSASSTGLRCCDSVAKAGRGAQGIAQVSLSGFLTLSPLTLLTHSLPLIYPPGTVRFVIRAEPG
jgi:hypothetical protein